MEGATSRVRRRSSKAAGCNNSALSFFMMRLPQVLYKFILALAAAAAISGATFLLHFQQILTAGSLHVYK